MILALILACGMGMDHLTVNHDDTGGAAALHALTISQLIPSSGPSTGGTAVTITGDGFTDGTGVTVGGEPCAALTTVSSVELACTTPAGSPGTVTVQVSRSEDDATASASFTYNSVGPGDDTGGADDTGGSGDDTGGGTSAVDYCHLQWPCSMTGAPGATSDALYVWVYQEGVTVGAGQGAGLTVQVGVGTDGSTPGSDWDWNACTYNVDQDGLTPGDLSNDEYMGSFTIPATPGAYDYAARVSADAGASWLLCDLGGDGCGGQGSGDGYSAAEAGALTVE